MIKVCIYADVETTTYDTNGDGVGDFVRVFDRGYDTLRRYANWSLNGAAVPIASAVWGYEPVAGRLGTVASAGDTFTYGYVPNAPQLVASVAGPAGITVTNTYEPNRDVLDLKEHKFGTALISRYDYGVNAMGRRTSLAQSGSAFAAMPLKVRICYGYGDHWVGGGRGYHFGP